ncbi:anti-sigma factor domain-containing protein [Paenibacillus alginolyticus]|uniref:anti-sigma factor domain-containing protein n=2 Tax=Paenibacillus alginolyticus TaxID=59839 RepID=UPI0022849486|nr:anti-sigma factor domain-containing protein [Paenibacillus alginolyticus]MCY9668337.1 anti-sigma factor domain-containing protein [Paenibacillus alginolyticus]
MKKTNGLVIKITEQVMVVMCDDGKFRNLPLPSKLPAVGERITVPLRRKKTYKFRWLSSIAASFILLLGLAVWYQTQPQYYDIIAIDINPSLELYVDAKERVIKVKPLNSDAEKVLTNFPLGQLKVSEAIERVISTSTDLGYINKNKENFIMISIANLKGKTISTSAINSVVTKSLHSTHVDAFLKLEQVDKPAYDLSKEKNVSLNKWILLQQFEHLGVQINLEKIASESLSEVLQETGINKEKLFLPIQESINPQKNAINAEKRLNEQVDKGIEPSNNTINATVPSLDSEGATKQVPSANNVESGKTSTSDKSGLNAPTIPEQPDTSGHSSSTSPTRSSVGSGLQSSTSPPETTGAPSPYNSPGASIPSSSPDAPSPYSSPGAPSSSGSPSASSPYGSSGASSPYSSPGAPSPSSSPGAPSPSSSPDAPSPSSSPDAPSPSGSPGASSPYSPPSTSSPSGSPSDSSPHSSPGPSSSSSSSGTSGPSRSR